jgi:hypothetical protein
MSFQGDSAGMRCGRILLPAAMSLLLTTLTPLAVSAQTQQVQLTISGGPASFPAPTAADLTAGSLLGSNALTFEAQTSEEPAVGTMTTKVFIRSSSATLGGGKPVADLEWRRGDDATWHPLTTSDAVIESRTTSFSESGHTWSNAVHFRVALHWVGDPPATYTGNLVFTITATQP